VAVAVVNGGMCVVDWLLHHIMAVCGTWRLRVH
jgi:hypothetical protein